MAFADPREEVVFYVPLWIRSGITLDQFDNYWRDVHGPVCARLPGQMEYWQYHLSPYTGGIFPEVKNININGRILIANKKRSFLSLRLKLNFIFFTNSQTRIKNGMSNPI